MDDDDLFKRDTIVGWLRKLGADWSTEYLADLLEGDFTRFADVELPVPDVALCNMQRPALRAQLEALPEQLLLWALLGRLREGQEGPLMVQPDPDRFTECAQDWLLVAGGETIGLLPAECNACGTSGYQGVTEAGNAKEAIAAILADNLTEGRS